MLYVMRVFLSLDSLCNESFLSLDALFNESFLSLDALCNDSFLSLDSLCNESLYRNAPQAKFLFLTWNFKRMKERTEQKTLNNLIVC